MPDKLDRFTKRARRALTLAQEEALRHRHSEIGPEHLLLPLVRDEQNTAAQLMRELGVNPEQVRNAVERAMTWGEYPPSGKPTLSQDAKRVIELAVDEARRMNSHFIGTEHLLLGIAAQGQSIATRVLDALKLPLDRMRERAVRHILQAQSPSKRPDVSRKPPHRSPPLAADLTSAAEAGQLDPLIGRERELERLLQILNRRTKHNALLIGEPGVGKRALVYGLAQRIATGQVPAMLLNRRLLKLELRSLGAGILERAFGEELQIKEMEEIISSGSLVFIEHIHRLVGSSAAGNRGVAAHLLKRVLSRGDIHAICTTTPRAYHDELEDEIADEWHFQPMHVKESSPEETLAILRGVKARYEDHHKVQIADETVTAAVELAVRHIREGFLPGKAIDLLDEASSRVRIQCAPDAATLREAFLALKQVQEGKEAALNAGELQEALAQRQRELTLRAEFDELLKGSIEAADPLPVTPQDVAEVVSLWTGGPTPPIPGEGPPQ